MKETRVTIRDYFNELKELVKGTEREVELTEFLDKRLAQLDKKAGSTNSKKAKEVAEKTETIYNALVELEKPATATEIAQNAGVSNQAASAYLKKLVADGRVARTVEKRVAYFSVVAE